MFLSSLNISGSALTAQRYRLDIISQNLANAETTRTENGGPYRRQVAVFEARGKERSFQDYLDDINDNYYLHAGNTFRNVSGLKYDDVTHGRFTHVAGNYFDNISYNKTSGSGMGVRVKEVVQDPTPNKMVYDPTHPDADENGYVAMPNVETLQEFVDMMSVQRSIEANVQALNAFKAMASKALEIGR